MAILSNDKTYVTVERGDTLSGIARTYLGRESKYKQLAAINNISNPDLIYVNQKIYLTKTTGGGSTGVSSKTTNSAPSKVTIKQFGLQSNADNTLFVTWLWNRSNTENYQVIWYYDSGNGHWFIGSDSTTDHKESTYNIPANANRVKVQIKPISKTHTVNNKETRYWTAKWSTEKYYDVKNIPPKAPSSAPTVRIDKYTLTAELDNLDIDATHIQFQIVKDNEIALKNGLAGIEFGHASYSRTILVGSSYKVRCRAYRKRDQKFSEWTNYSSSVSTIPAVPNGDLLICRANSKTSVYLKWTAVNTATSYDIEYTTERRYFDGSDKTTTKTDIKFTHYELTGLETGSTYFFRVRAVNSAGASGWSSIKTVAIGGAPAAPTTWSSTTTAIAGEPLTLYWVHNSEDGSSQTSASLVIYINGQGKTYTIQSSTDPDEKDKTSSFNIDTSTLTEGAQILWKVRTAGVTEEYGAWSVQRTIDVYAPPTLMLDITDASGNSIETLTSFPFYISAFAGPNTQAPVGYHLTITANSSYETVDNVGNKKTISKGDQVYSKQFDISEPLLVELSPNHIDLENNKIYRVTCLASMNSGLTAESSLRFKVAWTEEQYEPNAEISIDRDDISAHIRPYCESLVIEYYKVSRRGEIYTKTEQVLDYVWGELIPSAMTVTGEKVYYGVTADDESVYYCEVVSKIQIENVTLSVYRREYDGTFTEIATGLDNSRNTFVTDPHPALDYARYRIVATTNDTGAVSFYDVPGCLVGEKAVVIQWDEEWSNFDSINEDEIAEPSWSGSMLKLPYNIDISTKHSSDVSLVEYIGRKHPVTYYGTHLGETENWKVEIDAKDKETLYALRRLAIYMGDVYVREPSGSGYWANISVSYSQTHRELTIPVSFEITRVEGGM